MIKIKNGSRLGLVAAGIAGAALMLSACAPAAPAPEPTDSAAPPAEENEFFAMLPKAVQDAGVLKAGALFQTPPVIGASADKPDVAVGIVPDLGAALSEILGVEIQFVDTQWPNQIPGLQSGDLDLLWGQISQTYERETDVFDFIPWGDPPDGLLVLAGNPMNIETYSSMCGMRLALPNGGNQQLIITAISDEKCVGQGKPPIEQIPLQGGADAYAAVKAGTADAWMDSYTGVSGVANADSAFEAVRADTNEVPMKLRDFSGIAVMKTADTSLIEAIFAAFGELRASGEYERILGEWDVADIAVSDADFKINGLSGTAPGKTA